MLISSSGAPGERRPAPSHGAMRAIEQRVRKNPLGIYVNGLSWSRELEGNEGDVMDASLPTGKSIAAGARR